MQRTCAAAAQYMVGCVRYSLVQILILETKLSGIESTRESSFEA